MNVPLNQRSHNLFLSHSSRDKQSFVDALYQFLTKHAALKVWYDRGLTSGQVSSKLDTAIGSCRAAVIVISENSSNSHWVELECSRLMEEAARMREFRIATVRLDPIDPPGLLKSFKHIDAPDGSFSYDAAALLFETLYGGREITGGRPVYLSRGWRPSEAKAADRISEAAQSFGFKLVSDWTDQPDYDVERVRALMDGCGGLIAILPHRGQGETSRYILREIQVARDLGIPVLAFAHADVVIDAALRIDAVRFDDSVGTETATIVGERYSGRFEDLTELWKKPGGGEHVFFGHSLEASVGDSFMTIRRMLSRLTGLPVVVGGEVVARDAQEEIVRLIRESELSVIDITNVAHPGIPDKIDFGLNSCIEAGIALGSNRSLYLTCRGSRRSPPFMFRNKQVWFYEDELELIGKLRQIAARHRRMVL